MIQDWLYFFYNEHENVWMYGVKNNDLLSWNDGDVCNAAIVDQVLQKKVNPICLDIGVDQGWWTAFCLKSNPTATVYAFEPNPPMIKILNERFQNDNRVILIPKAVSDTEDGISFTSDGACSNSRNENGKIVPSTRLDFIFQRHSFIDCIKLDTEGHEIIILRSIDKYYNQINTLIFEFTPYWYGSSESECLSESFSIFEKLFEYFPYIYTLSRRGLPILTQIESEEDAFVMIRRNYIDKFQTDIVCSKVSITLPKFQERYRTDLTE